MSKCNTSKILAWRKYPIPDGMYYYQENLETKEAIIQLFDACQLLEASITADGWDYLLSNFGVKEIYQIDQKSGWLDMETPELWLEALLYQALLAGYNISTRQFGSYDEAKDIFITTNGNQKNIDWEGFKALEIS